MHVVFDQRLCAILKCLKVTPDCQSRHNRWERTGKVGKHVFMCLAKHRPECENKQRDQAKAKLQN